MRALGLHPGPCCALHTKPARDQVDVLLLAFRPSPAASRISSHDDQTEALLGSYDPSNRQVSYTGDVQAGLQKKILPLMGKESDASAVLNAHRNLKPIYALLEQQLSYHQYLCGEFSLVDCAFAPWLPYLHLDDFPLLQAWQKRLEERPAWKRSYSRKRNGSPIGLPNSD